MSWPAVPLSILHVGGTAQGERFHARPLSAPTRGWPRRSAHPWSSSRTSRASSRQARGVSSSTARPSSGGGLPHRRSQGQPRQLRCPATPETRYRGREPARRPAVSRADAQRVGGTGATHIAGRPRTPTVNEALAESPSPGATLRRRAMFWPARGIERRRMAALLPGQTMRDLPEDVARQLPQASVPAGPGWHADASVEGAHQQVFVACGRTPLEGDHLGCGARVCPSLSRPSSDVARSGAAADVR